MSSVALDVHGVIASAHGAPWNGMPVGTILGHVHLHVGDIESGARFYHAALGFDRVVWSYPGALFLSAGGYHHHLGTNTWAAHAPRAADEDARLLEWSIVLPEPRDVDDAALSVDAAGFAHTREGTDLLVRDPWGTVARVTAER